MTPTNQETSSFPKENLPDRIVPFWRHGSICFLGCTMMNSVIQSFVFIALSKTLSLKGNLRCATKKDQKFISAGFCNWKKALDKFRQHESSECHKMAIDYAVNFPKSCRNVIEMTNEESKKVRQINRRCLLLGLPVVRRV